MNEIGRGLAACLAILVATSVAACSNPDSGSGSSRTPGPPAGSGAAQPGAPAEELPSPPATSPGSPRTLTFELWLVRDGELFATTRTRPAEQATARLALRTLLAGATPAEGSAGVGTALDAATRFDIALSGGVATVEAPATFYGGGRALARLRQAQVVYTLTQYPTIARVGFQRDGEATAAPLGRADYADLLPAVVVTSPGIGQSVRSPATVRGTADVFEATVSVRILDASGRELARGVTTAAGPGTGHRPYSLRLPFRVGATQTGTIEAFEESAKDGAHLHVMRIPVTLAS